MLALALLLPLATLPPTCGPLTAPLPFSNRASFAELQRHVLSRFADGRTSYVRGHLHSGIDVAGAEGAPVTPLCPGTVVDIHLGFPHTTVVVEHHDADGTRWFSTYKHVAAVGVAVGGVVEPATRLGRLFTAREQRTSGWKRTHLHLEVRRRFDDGGSASWTSMDRPTLDRFFADPLPLLRARLAGP